MNRWPFIKQYIKSISCSWKNFWNVCAFDKYCMSFNSSVIRVSKHRESITTGSRKSPTSRLRFQFCPRLQAATLASRSVQNRTEQNGRVIWFAKRCVGGVVGVPERRGAVVVYTITTRVYGDVLEVFWSYCSEVGFFKVLRNKKRRIWVRSFLLTYIPIRFLECLVCVGLRELWLWSLWIPLVKSRSGEQKDLIECRFLSSHHKLLIKKQMPPPLLFPVSSFVLSEQWTENPVSLMAESGTFADIQVSVRQIMLQSLVSRCMRCAPAVHRVCCPVTESEPAKWLGEEVERHGVSVWQGHQLSSLYVSLFAAVWPRQRALLRCL